MPADLAKRVSVPAAVEHRNALHLARHGGEGPRLMYLSTTARKKLQPGVLRLGTGTGRLHAPSRRLLMQVQVRLGSLLLRGPGGRIGL